MVHQWKMFIELEMEQLLMVMDLLMGFIATGMVYMSKETVPHFAD